MWVGIGLISIALAVVFSVVWAGRIIDRKDFNVVTNNSVTKETVSLVKDEKDHVKPGIVFEPEVEAMCFKPDLSILKTKVETNLKSAGKRVEGSVSEVVGALKKIVKEKVG